MSVLNKKLPLVLDTTGQTQRLQPADKLSPEGTGLASQCDFEELQRNFRSLCKWLVDEGFDLPEKLELQADLL